MENSGVYIIYTEDSKTVCTRTVLVCSSACQKLECLLCTREVVSLLYVTGCALHTPFVFHPRHSDPWGKFSCFSIHNFIIEIATAETLDNHLDYFMSYLRSLFLSLFLYYIFIPEYSCRIAVTGGLQCSDIQSPRCVYGINSAHELARNNATFD